MKRKEALRRIAETNTVVSATKYAIYTARGVALTGIGAPAAASLPALLQTNRATAVIQDGFMAALAAFEAASLACHANDYSHELAGCDVSPSALSALKREPTLFPDVKGPLVHRKNNEALARIRCWGGLQLRTEIVLRGDPSLVRFEFEDKYEK